MDFPRTVAERPRCPTHDRPLLTLYYQRRITGKLENRRAPWLYCEDCERVFPAPE